MEEEESELDFQRRNVFGDDYEYNDPPGEVIIYPDCIHVCALGFREGFKSMLPKGGIYQGKGTGTWKYPNTTETRAIFGGYGDLWNGCPVLIHPDAK